MASPYVISYYDEFWFDADAEALWEMAQEVEEYEGRWSWLREFRADGALFDTGTVLYGVIRPPIPYTMRGTIVVGSCVRPSEINAEIHGDLEGVGGIVFTPQDTGTLVAIAWEIEMMQRAMRIAARFAYPLMRWAHDRVVEATVAGMRRHLEEEPAAS